MNRRKGKAKFKKPIKPYGPNPEYEPYVFGGADTSFEPDNSDLDGGIYEVGIRRPLSDFAPKGIVAGATSSVAPIAAAAATNTSEKAAQTASAAAADTAKSVFSTGLGTAVGGAAMGLSSLAGSLLGPVIQEKEQENYADFQYGLAKTAARDSGMPLANVLGFGSSAPSATSYVGGLSTITTKGQGLSNPRYKGTESQILNGYGAMW